MNLLPRSLASALLALASFAGIIPAQAAPGDLDSQYHNGAGSGYALVLPVGSYPNAGMALQSDGKLVLVGDVYMNNTSSFLLARRLPSGTAETGFGFWGPPNQFGAPFFEGQVKTAVGPGSSSAHAVAIQSDGKIVVVGQASNGSNDDFAVVRYLPNVTLDPAFGSGGIVITPLSTGDDSGRSVAVQGDGRILVAGIAQQMGTTIYYNLAVVRYNADGSLDTGFGSSGKVMTALGAPFNAQITVALQGDGKLVVVGSSNSGDVVLARFLADGSPDPTFGAGGVTLTSLGGTYNWANGALIQADGKIVVSATVGTYPNYSFTVLRYLGSGNLDPSFGIGGRVTTPIAGTLGAKANGVVMDRDGKIIVTGYSYTDVSTSPYRGDMLVVRYTSAGTLDTTFNGDGISATHFESYNPNASGFAVAVQADRKIVVLGDSSLAPATVVARFLGGPYTTYEQWKISLFGSMTAPDLGDPDSDGIPTLAEYGLALNPTSRSASPSVTVSGYSEGQRLRMLLLRDPARNGATVTVEAADSLFGPWTAVATSTLGAPFTGPGYVGGDNTTLDLKIVEVRDVVNLSDSSHRFLRVNVMAP